MDVKVFNVLLKYRTYKEENYGFIECLFFGIGPALLILSLTNDEKAKIECLNSTYELENEFEKLFRAQRNMSRSEKDDYDCLLQIKTILQKIKVQKASLTISYYPMDKLIEESLNGIRRMNPTDENPHYHIVQTGTCILLKWGKFDRIRSEFKHLKDVQRFLGRSFPARFCEWLQYLPIKLKEKCLKLWRRGEGELCKTSGNKNLGR